MRAGHTHAHSPACRTCGAASFCRPPSGRGFAVASPEEGLPTPRRKRIMHREAAEAAEARRRDAVEEAEARRRDAVEAPRGRVRAGAVCHAASGASAAPRRGEVRADDAPAGPREQASEAGRHTRRSTVPTARCRDTTTVFGSSWQVILKVWRDKYTKKTPAKSMRTGFPPRHAPTARRMVRLRH